MRTIGSMVVRNREVASVIALTEDGRAVVETSKGVIGVCDNSWSDFPFKIGDLVQTNAMDLESGLVTKIDSDGIVHYNCRPCGSASLWYNLHIVKDDFKLGDLVTTLGWNKQTYAEIISIRDHDVETLDNYGKSVWIAKSCLLKFEAKEPWWPGAFITYTKLYIASGDPSDFKMRVTSDGKGVDWTTEDTYNWKLQNCANFFATEEGRTRLMKPTEIREIRKHFESPKVTFEPKVIYKIETCFAEWYDEAFHFMDSSQSLDEREFSRWKIVKAEKLPHVERVAMDIQSVGGSSIGWWNLSIETRKDWRKTARAACCALNVDPNGIS